MIDTRERFNLSTGASVTYFSLPLLEKSGMAAVSRLPVSLRILLESVLRNVDGRRIRNVDVEALACWQPAAARTDEVPFVVGRVLLQDFTGVPLLVDLAAMRSAIAERGLEVARVQPSVPVDLVIDHSVQVDHFGRGEALRLNMKMEFRRNDERRNMARPSATFPSTKTRAGIFWPRGAAANTSRSCDVTSKRGVCSGCRLATSATTAPCSTWILPAPSRASPVQRDRRTGSHSAGSRSNSWRS
jgi:hypothetical protein